MVGRELSEFYDRQVHNPGKPVLSLKDLRCPSYPQHPLSLEVSEGEIVGVAGLVGAGRTELLQTIFGVTPALGGSLQISGEAKEIRNPRTAISVGIALAPEDRKQHGLVLPMSVRENSSLPSLQRDASRGWLNENAERTVTQNAVKSMKIKTPNYEQMARFLSGGNQQKIVLGKWLAMSPKLLLLDGGNQQKIVLGKWLAMSPKLLLLDEPTRGIDVGAKREIYKLMEKLAGEGMAILFVSSEMEEVLGMADRAYVMHEGQISGELSRDQLSEKAIMNLATGNLAAA